MTDRQIEKLLAEENHAPADYQFEDEYTPRRRGPRDVRVVRGTRVA